MLLQILLSEMAQYDFEQRLTAGSADRGGFRNNAEDVLELRRESDERHLSLLTSQRDLYVNPGDVPFQLREDIETYKVRLAVTDDLGRDLPIEQQIENLTKLSEQPSDLSEQWSPIKGRLKRLTSQK
jgi:hypothetical protein